MGPDHLTSTEPLLLSGWCTYAAEVFTAMRACYSYPSSVPDRATGWLFAARGIGMLPQTPWPQPLAQLGPALINDLAKSLGTQFEAACFQAYLDGAGVAWHHDREWAAQAILSLGVTRTFGLRSQNGETFTKLAQGDLLYMPPGFQHEWEHCVPAEEITGERCSLVFRSAA